MKIYLMAIIINLLSINLNWFKLYLGTLVPWTDKLMILSNDFSSEKYETLVCWTDKLMILSNDVSSEKYSY